MSHSIVPAKHSSDIGGKSAGDFNPFKADSTSSPAQPLQPPAQDKLLASGISTPKFGS